MSGCRSLIQQAPIVLRRLRHPYVDYGAPLLFGSAMGIHTRRLAVGGRAPISSRQCSKLCYVPNPPRAPRESGELVVMWLKSAGAIVRWGPREDAMRFATKGEARRVARTLRLRDGWSIEEA